METSRSGEPNVSRRRDINDEKAGGVGVSVSAVGGSSSGFDMLFHRRVLEVG